MAPTDRRGVACATELVAAPAAVVVDRRPPRAEMLLAAIADAAIFDAPGVCRGITRLCAEPTSHNCNCRWRVWVLEDGGMEERSQ